MWGSIRMLRPPGIEWMSQLAVRGWPLLFHFHLLLNFHTAISSFPPRHQQSTMPQPFISRHRIVFSEPPTATLLLLEEAREGAHRPPLIITEVHWIPSVRLSRKPPWIRVFRRKIPGEGGKARTAVLSEAMCRVALILRFHGFLRLDPICNLTASRLERLARQRHPLRQVPLMAACT